MRARRARASSAGRARGSSGARSIRLLFPTLLLQARDNVVARGEANDALWSVGQGAALVIKLWDAPHDGPQRRARVGLHHDTVADTRRIRRRVERQYGLRAPDRRQLD